MAIDVNTLNRLSASKKAAIMLLVVVVISALYYFMFYQNLMEQMEKKKKKHEKVLTERASLQEIEIELKIFMQQVETLEQRLKKALLELPDSKEIDKLLLNINRMGEESGLNFKQFKPLPEKNRKYYAELPVKMEVEGTYQDVNTFFSKISKLDRIINISEIHISDSREKARRMFMKIECKATTFKFVKNTGANNGKGKKKKKEKKK